MENKLESICLKKYSAANYLNWLNLTFYCGGYLRKCHFQCLCHITSLVVLLENGNK